MKQRLADYVAVCVTTGPGGTNALTGVVGGWLDSIPMFIVSGQVRYDTTARYALQYTGTPLRAMGDQEYDITKSVQYMTKFAAMLEDPKDIRYLLEKAWHLATTGRPGPVWLVIPVNFQGGYIETDELRGYDPAEDDAQLPPSVDDATMRARRQHGCPPGQLGYPKRRLDSGRRHAHFYSPGRLQLEDLGPRG